MCTFTLEDTHFIFNECPIYTHDGASAQCSINSQETDYCVGMTGGMNCGALRYAEIWCDVWSAVVCVVCGIVCIINLKSVYGYSVCGTVDV